MSRNLSLAEGMEQNLKAFVDAAQRIYETTDMFNPQKNPDFRQFLKDEYGMTDEQIDEERKNASEG